MIFVWQKSVGSRSPLRVDEVNPKVTNYLPIPHGATYLRVDVELNTVGLVDYEKRLYPEVKLPITRWARKRLREWIGGKKL